MSIDENELKHTKVTDEILDIIDNGDTNRYQVALRLTAWVERRTASKKPPTTVKLGNWFMDTRLPIPFKNWIGYKIKYSRLTPENYWEE